MSLINSLGMACTRHLGSYSAVGNRSPCCIGAAVDNRGVNLGNIRGRVRRRVGAVHSIDSRRLAGRRHIHPRTSLVRNRPRLVLSRL